MGFMSVPTVEAMMATGLVDMLQEQGVAIFPFMDSYMWGVVGDPDRIDPIRLALAEAEAKQIRLVNDIQPPPAEFVAEPST